MRYIKRFNLQDTLIFGERIPLRVDVVGDWCKWSLNEVGVSPRGVPPQFSKLEDGRAYIFIARETRTVETQ